MKVALSVALVPVVVVGFVCVALTIGNLIAWPIDLLSRRFIYRHFIDGLFSGSSRELLLGYGLFGLLLGALAGMVFLLAAMIREIAL